MAHYLAAFGIIQPSGNNNMKLHVLKLAVVAGLAFSLSGCFLTKIVTMPMRVVGSTLSTVGAVTSVVPGVGNKIDATLEKGDAAIDEAADTVDKVPL